MSRDDPRHHIGGLPTKPDYPGATGDLSEPFPTLWTSISHRPGQGIYRVPVRPEIWASRPKEPTEPPSVSGVRVPQRPAK
jgi:hypothetical protein